MAKFLEVDSNSWHTAVYGAESKNFLSALESKSNHVICWASVIGFLELTCLLGLLKHVVFMLLLLHLDLLITRKSGSFWC